jgi:hypothetical protein
MRFSERIGAVRRVLQKESIDESLKNSLWNAVYKRFWEHHTRRMDQPVTDVIEGQLLLSLWTEHFNQPADEALMGFKNVVKQIRGLYMVADWWGVYDFVEFVVNYPRSREQNANLIAELNLALEKHLSAYRFVGMTLAPITSEEEITAVEEAMSHGDQFRPVVAHLETALARLADRVSPDYRNSIKESVSAVEAVCQILTSDAKTSLGQALKKLGIHLTCLDFLSQS